jgi:hypothetical protein
MATIAIAAIIVFIAGVSAGIIAVVAGTSRILRWPSWPRTG